MLSLSVKNDDSVKKLFLLTIALLTALFTLQHHQATFSFYSSSNFAGIAVLSAIVLLGIWYDKLFEAFIPTTFFSFLHLALTLVWISALQMSTVSTGIAGQMTLDVLFYNEAAGVFLLTSAIAGFVALLPKRFSPFLLAAIGAMFISMAWGIIAQTLSNGLILMLFFAGFANQCLWVHAQRTENDAQEVA